MTQGEAALSLTPAPSHPMIVYLTSPDRTHSHVVQQGDTLSGIAGQYYRRPGEWREIALDENNRIDDPRRLQVGAFLRVPPLPE